MAFLDADIDAAVLMASTADTVRANLKTHVNTLHTNLTTVLITDAGKTANDAEVIDVFDKLLALAEQCAKATQDHTA